MTAGPLRASCDETEMAVALRHEESEEATRPDRPRDLRCWRRLQQHDSCQNLVEWDESDGPLRSALHVGAVIPPHLGTH